MQLTRYTDYGLRILIFLAIQPEGRLSSIDEVCGTFDLPHNHINKIVHQLGKLGWVTTRRGKGGGIMLGLPAEAINLGEVVHSLEGKMQLIDCAEPLCQLLPVCQLKGVLAEAVEAFLSTLCRHSLADLIRNTPAIRHQLSIPLLNL
jgi:Rrf2 family transcriptional regulator, nitric oxide-sensitive transcriptional repressor